MRHWRIVLVCLALLGALSFAGYRRVGANGAQESRDRNDKEESSQDGFDGVVRQNVQQMVKDGRETFRFDTFGDEAFWGNTLHLHQAIEGANLGGVGPGVSPATALAVGLKVDLDALPPL
jgi:precorrin-2 methylase